MVTKEGSGLDWDWERLPLTGLDAARDEGTTDLEGDQRIS
jgi:hypothetical protein